MVIFNEPPPPINIVGCNALPPFRLPYSDRLICEELCNTKDNRRSVFFFFFHLLLTFIRPQWPVTVSLKRLRGLPRVLLPFG
jgi:hypothetical protein